MTTLPGPWPFTWASTAWVADRETSPPRVREYCMILDDYSARFPVEAECFRHGVVAVTVTDLLSALPRGVAKLQESRKSAPVTASRVVS